MERHPIRENVLEINPPEAETESYLLAKPRLSSWMIRAVMAAAFLVSGCGQSLEDLVRVNRPRNNSVIPFEGQAAMKISPGTAIATSTDVSMSAHVTITDRPIAGSDVSARVSVGRNRKSDQ